MSTFPWLELRWPGASLPLAYTKGPIVIENDVWVDNKATFLSGVRVGSGAVIGANAVVAKDMPPYAIVAGNPARVVGQRFSDERVEALLKIEWWHWPDELIIERMPYFEGPVEEFIRAFSP